MLLVAIAELRPRECMTLPAEMLEGVRRGDRAQTRAGFVIRSMGESLHQAAAIRITDARGIGDAMWRQGWDINAGGPFQNRRPVLAFRDDQDLRRSEDVRLTPAGLLADQLEFIIVADDDERAGQAIRQLIARHARALLAGVEDVRDPE